MSTATEKPTRQKPYKRSKHLDPPRLQYPEFGEPSGLTQRLLVVAECLDEVSERLPEEAGEDPDIRNFLNRARKEVDALFGNAKGEQESALSDLQDALDLFKLLEGALERHLTSNYQRPFRRAVSLVEEALLGDRGRDIDWWFELPQEWTP